MSLKKLFEEVLYQYRTHRYEIGATLHKNDTGIPVNVWIDDMTWKNSGHWKRMKFQPDTGDRSDIRKFIPMSIEDEPKILVKKKTSLSSREIEMIKEFVRLNKSILLQYGDQEISIGQFMKKMKKLN